MRLRLSPGARLVLLAALLVAAESRGEPLDLEDPRPRWVEVRFEISPPSRPGALDAVYTDELPAWFRPSLRPGWALVAVPAAVVEEKLLAGQEPKPGTFSDFVWVFDTRTGHVIDARLHGIVTRHLDWGLFSSSVEAEIDTELSTERRLGFRAARRLLGQRLHAPCTPGEASCTPVAPVALQRDSGYVNAVGEIRARSKGLVTRSFSTLGEARFSERSPELPHPAIARRTGG